MSAEIPVKLIMLSKSDRPRQVVRKRVKAESLSYLTSSHSDKEKKLSMDLVRESFGDVEESYEDYYNWTYLENPIGTGNVLFAFDADRPVGQVGSIPCLYWFMDRIVATSLAIDVCVTPEYRGNGIIVELMRRIPMASKGIPFSLSVPSTPSIKGHIRNNYEQIPMLVVVRPLRVSNYFRNKAIKMILKPFDGLFKKKGVAQIREHIGPFDVSFDELAMTTCKPRTIRQLRSSQFLNWRYKNNPRRKYKVLTAFKNGILSGYIITRSITLEGKKAGYIIDFVATESASGKDLISTALQDFWDNDVAYSRAACFPNCQELKLFKEAGFFVYPRRLLSQPSKLCVKILDENSCGHNVVDINKWFFMLGDNDSH